MKETDLKKTDSAVSCICYLFDPDNNTTTCKVINARDEHAFPEYGKVFHHSGRRYCVYFRGHRDTLEKRQAAFDLFKQFYLDKLADAAKNLSRAAETVQLFL